MGYLSRNRLACLGVSLGLLFVPACGGESGEGTSGGGGEGGGGSTTTTTATGTGTGTGTGTATSTGAGAEFKSYVVLGDSISDGGGQGPYFYDSFTDDLVARYGQGLQYVHAAVGGSVAGNLLEQINGLPATLPGPVLVSITIGGNDIQAAAIQIVSGDDQAARDKFRTKLSEALTALTAPDRFGPGVEVWIYQTDIYDPSDGNGDFAAQGCPAPLSYLPQLDTDPIFANWNDVVLDEVPKYGAHTTVLPLHATFYGHGVGAPDADTYFVADCIHPNAPGHEAIRQLYKTAVIGP